MVRRVLGMLAAMCLVVGVMPAAAQSQATNGTIDSVSGAGDTFTVGPNTSGIADGRNALALAAQVSANRVAGAYLRQIGRRSRVQPRDIRSGPPGRILEHEPQVTRLGRASGDRNRGRTLQRSLGIGQRRH